ncbi:MAG: hypothetical protein JXQ30_06305 [Spirochaetes bacterium]|nr:hypothetical protein [Spirochaetota bacterium]
MMTTEEFWSQLGTYNTATWHVQVAWTAAVIVIICMVFTRRTAWANISMKVLLSFAFAWNGAVYFLLFSDGPVYDFFFAPLFFAVAILFILDIFVKRTAFSLPENRWKRYITLFWILLWLLYPLIGLALGRGFPKVCTPMNPCPVTVLAIGLTAAAIPRIDRKSFISLLPWALMGLPKCLGVYQCHEDCVLFAAGVYGLVMLIVGWRAIGRESA